jgi:DNA-binding NarL/FixJ family response regulator
VRRVRRRQTGGMKVFIVEDSVPVRERLEAMLGAIPGVSILGSAAGATQAVGAILAGRPEVVLLDLSLAEGSGFDVLREVRASAPEIDVYMLSNFSAFAYRDLAERLGARGYFDKSREFERVRDVIASRAATHA